MTTDDKPKGCNDGGAPLPQRGANGTKDSCRVCVLTLDVAGGVFAKREMYVWCLLCGRNATQTGQ